MDDDDWMGGGGGGSNHVNDVQPEPDDYSFEDSEQFEDDSICSVHTDSNDPDISRGGGNHNWRGWDEGDNGDIPSTSGGDGGGYSQQPFVVSSDTSPPVSASRSSLRGRESAASTYTLTPKSIMGKGMNCGRSSVRSINTTCTLTDNTPLSLFVTSAKVCARYLPFYGIEDYYNKAMLYRYTLPPGEDGERLASMSAFRDGPHPIPDKIFLSITWWCFPDNEDDIRLYSCLASGSLDDFNRGKALYTGDCVEKVMQIGYFVSAVVYQPAVPPDTENNRSIDEYTRIQRRQSMNNQHNGQIDGVKRGLTYTVSMSVDRCRIIQCECSCNKSGMWCQHLVALCLFRLHQKDKVEFRVTIWDSINELNTNQLKKFAQYFINCLPRRYLPDAQRMLDDVRDPNSAIYNSTGAPDPTDGGHETTARWQLDTGRLHETVASRLYRFCQPSPTVHCDVQFLSSTPPAIASEWQLLLRPLKTKLPEGIWNLLSIVRAMFKRRDENAIQLLHVITDEILASTHMLVWWLISSLEQSGRWTHSSDRKSNPLLTNYEVPSLCAAALCQEMVSLWRIAALNPSLRSDERRQLDSFIQLYHKTAVERLWILIDSQSRNERTMNGSRNGRTTTEHNNIISLLISTTVNEERLPLSCTTIRFNIHSFPGFFSALQACNLTWTPAELGIYLPISNELNQSPHLPQFGGLRRPYTVSAICPNSFFYGGYGMDVTSSSNKKSKKSKKKKKSSSSSTKRNTTKQMFDITDMMDGLDYEDGDSGESGQESDMPGPSTRIQRNSGRGRQLGGLNPSLFDDVNTLFAAAYIPLEGLDLKLARCEALSAHGHTSFACDRAIELVLTLSANLPTLVWTYDKHDDTPDTSAPPSTGFNKFAHQQQQQSSQSSYQFQAGTLPQKYHSIPNHLPYNPSSHKSSSSIRRNGKIVAIPDSGLVAPPPPVLLPNPKIHERSELACNTFERVLMLAKQLEPYPSHHLSVFGLLLDLLAHPKGAMSTSYLQVKMYHLESEVLTVLLNMIKIRLNSEELEMIREKAYTLSRWEIISNDDSLSSNLMEKGVPPVSLATFIFNSLVISDNLLLRPEDERLSVSACLSVIGSRHPYSESLFPMLGECLRRQRGELALLLIKRYKDTPDHLGLVLDRLLDPTLHRMYKYSKTNAVYFLENDPIYGSVISKGERPTLIAPPPSHEIVSGSNLSTHSSSITSSLIYGDIGRMDEEDDDTRDIPSTSRRSSLKPPSLRSEGGKSSSVDESEESNANDDRLSFHSNRRSSDEGNESSSNNSGVTSSGSGIIRRTNTIVGGGGGGGGKGIIRVNTSIHESRSIKRTRTSPPCEAHAHYMFELAKRIHSEAGGDQSSALFHAAAVPVFQVPVPVPVHNVPHRRLLMSSFLIGLYALGLSNEASRSWASRTYSTSVSWINSQTLDIGAPALEVIRSTWYSHLTPPEAAALADKASQSREASTVCAGARLALSVLQSVHALSPNEGHRALVQCREQGATLLEQAISTIEEVSRIEEVCPEILFTASRFWADLAMESDPGSIQPMPQHYPQQYFGGGMDQSYQLQQHGPSSLLTPNPYFQSAIQHQQQQLIVQQQQQHVVQQPLPSQQGGGSYTGNGLWVPHQGGQSQMIGGGYGGGSMPPGYMTQYMGGVGQGGYGVNIQRPQGIDEDGSSQSSSSSSTSGMGRVAGPSMASSHRPMHTSHSAPNLGPHMNRSIGQMKGSGQPVSSIQQQPQPITTHDPKLERLFRAQHLGLRAMEKVASRGVEDRSFNKFSPNPPFCDEIRWLFTLSYRISHIAILSFCDIATKTVWSPHLLSGFVIEMLKLFPSTHHGCIRMAAMCKTPLGYGQGKFRAAGLAAGWQAPTADLLDRAMEMAYSAITYKMTNQSRLVNGEFDEVLQMLTRMRDMLHYLPNGWSLFEELTAFVRKQRCCTKELGNKLQQMLYGNAWSESTTGGTV